MEEFWTRGTPKFGRILEYVTSEEKNIPNEWKQAERRKNVENIWKIFFQSFSRKHLPFLDNNWKKFSHRLGV